MDYTRRYENRHYSMGSNIFAVLQDKEVVMRIIDADALMKVLKISDDCKHCEQCEYDYFCSMGGDFVSACEAINEAPSIETKQIKYFDDDEKVWKIGSVIVNE